MALRALGLALGVEEEFSTRRGVAAEVGLPGTLAGGAGQAADVSDQRSNLVLLEGVAHLLHRGLGHAIPDDEGDVGVAAAVDTAVVGQVGPFAASASTAVTAAAQAAKQRLAFRQRRWTRSRGAGGPFSRRWVSDDGAGVAVCQEPFPEGLAAPSRVAHNRAH